MPIKYETGKIVSPVNEEVSTVTLLKNYTSSPVIKVTCDSNENIYLQNITTQQFEIVNNSEEEVTIHYIVIER